MEDTGAGGARRGGFPSPLWGDAVFPREPPAAREASRPTSRPPAPRNPQGSCPLSVLGGPRPPVPPGRPDGVSSASLSVWGGPLLAALLLSALHFGAELKIVPELGQGQVQSKSLNSRELAGCSCSCLQDRGRRGESLPAQPPCPEHRDVLVGTRGWRHLLCEPRP